MKMLHKSYTKMYLQFICYPYFKDVKKWHYFYMYKDIIFMKRILWLRLILCTGEKNEINLISTKTSQTTMKYNSLNYKIAYW